MQRNKDEYSKRTSMNNIEILGKKAIDFLKNNNANFPKHGFIAGGSISNLIWEYVSGNKAKVNDIDIFVFKGIVSKGQNDYLVNDKKPSYLKKERKYYEHEYHGLCSSSEDKEYYIIDETETIGIYNYIYYSSNITTPNVIINSFDINCTQVGYSIEEDKFYWSDEFSEFLKTGEVQLSNVRSPAHSAIRLIKKKYDLNASLNEIELKICQFALFNTNDLNRRYFSSKYFMMYLDYKDKLDTYFQLVKDDITKEFMLTKGIDIEVFTLEPNIGIQRKEIFKDKNIDKIWSGENLIFYLKNIKNNEKKLNMWNKLGPIYNKKNQDYFDPNISDDDIEMLSRLIRFAPNIIENLKGMSLSNQVGIMKKMFHLYKDDPIVAISIMEKTKIDLEKDFDENDLLLMELSVRKQIISDVKNKVDNILYPKKDEENSVLLNGVLISPNKQEVEITWF